MRRGNPAVRRTVALRALPVGQRRPGHDTEIKSLPRADKILRRIPRWKKRRRFSFAQAKLFKAAFARIRDSLLHGNISPTSTSPLTRA